VSRPRGGAAVPGNSAVDAGNGSPRRSRQVLARATARLARIDDDGITRHPDPEDGDVSFMTRLGAGWEFELAHGFTIAPEVNIDLVEGGDGIPVIVGLTFGYDF